MVSSTRMTLTAGIDARIGEGTPAATPMGRAAAPCWLAVRDAMGSPQRVRAFMRVTRRAKASTCCGRVEAADSARRTARGDRRKPAGVWFGPGGPSPLTEDRQKPNRRRCGACELAGMLYPDGRRGTRNTVPSRADQLSRAVKVLRQTEPMA
jgi:hypothetical protein